MIRIQKRHSSMGKFLNRLAALAFALPVVALGSAPADWPAAAANSEKTQGSASGQKTTAPAAPAAPATNEFAPGMEDNKNHRYMNAVVAFSKALEKNPRNAKAYCYRGFAFCCMNQYVKGNADLSEAIKLDRNLADAYFYRARMNDHRTELVKAIADYEQVLRIRPNDEDALFSMAENCAELKMTDRAIPILNKMLKLYPDNIYGRALRGNIYNSTKEHPEISIEDFTVVINKKGEDYTRYLLQRAFAYERLGKEEKAIADYSELLKLNPDDDDTYNYRAKAYEKTRHYKEAIADYSKAISIYPEFSGSSYYGRGRCYEALGQKDRAKADYDTAAKRGYKPATEKAKSR
ncbi:MAG TPA: tetratricopeptide repeat protein [Chroococcales cyanobacterium]